VRGAGGRVVDRFTKGITIGITKNCRHFERNRLELEFRQLETRR